MMNTAAIRTAARMARFSIVKAGAFGSAEGPRRRDETGGNEGAATPRARCRAGDRAPRWRASRTPSTSARSGRRSEGTVTPAAGKSRPRRGRSASRPSRPRARNGRERPAQLGCECRKGYAQRGWTPDDHERGVRWGGVADCPIGLAQAATGPVALNGAADLPAHREAGPPRLCSLAPEHDHRRPVDSLATLEEGLKFSAGRQPVSPRETARQTVSRFRPFARRRFRTFRPPFVFIRSRKPCVFFRRRTFGWYVRLIGKLLPSVVQPA